jgi:hypothetical protein
MGQRAANADKNTIGLVSVPKPGPNSCRSYRRGSNLRILRGAASHTRQIDALTVERLGRLRCKQFASRALFITGTASCEVMSKRQPDSTQDLRQTQRNVIWPDPLRNSRAVDVFLWRGVSISYPHPAGRCVAYRDLGFSNQPLVRPSWLHDPKLAVYCLWLRWYGCCRQDAH